MIFFYISELPNWHSCFPFTLQCCKNTLLLLVRGKDGRRIIMIKGLEHKTMALAVDDLVLHLEKLREMLVVCSKRFRSWEWKKEFMGL